MLRSLSGARWLVVVATLTPKNQSSSWQSGHTTQVRSKTDVNFNPFCVHPFPHPLPHSIDPRPEALKHLLNLKSTPAGLLRDKTGSTALATALDLQNKTVLACLYLGVFRPPHTSATRILTQPLARPWVCCLTASSEVAEVHSAKLLFMASLTLNRNGNLLSSN